MQTITIQSIPCDSQILICRFSQKSQNLHPDNSPPDGVTLPVGPYAGPTGKKNPLKPSHGSINGTYGQTGGAAGGAGRTRIELFFVCLYSVDPPALV